MPEFSIRTQPVARCPLCRGGERAERIRVSGPLGFEARFVECAGCGMVYMDPAPDEETLAAFYRDIYTRPEFRAADGHMHQDPRQEFVHAFPVQESHMDEIEKHKSAPGRLLDAGCAYGGLLLEAALRGWEAAGVEPSEDAARFCRDSLGLNVKQAGLLDADLPEGAFDVIVMLEVIEHVPQPVRALRRAARLAAPGALLYLSCPNAQSAAARILGDKWIGWKPPTHLQFFGYGTMRQLLERTGWRPLRVFSGGGYPGQIRALAQRTD